MINLCHASPSPTEGSTAVLASYPLHPTSKLANALRSYRMQPDIAIVLVPVMRQTGHQPSR
jgi:hypothetical protein